MTKIVIACVCLLVMLCSLYSQSKDSVILEKEKEYPAWAVFTPAGTYFYDERFYEGVTLSVIEASSIIIGIRYNESLKRNGSTGYYNYPLLIGVGTLTYDKMDLIHSKLSNIKRQDNGFQYDPISTSDVIIAPFKIENIFTPITIGFVGAALVEVWYNGKASSKQIADVDKVFILDRYYHRGESIAVYGAASLAISVGAGINEEYLFRNTLMPLLDRQYGQKNGLMYSSALFGFSHAANILFTKQSDKGKIISQICQATLAGYFLGNDVQKRGYKIGPAIAAHVWYDFSLMIGTFLLDPKKNHLAMSVKFTLD
jgi:membrane protease YdiL (CAAX protease family)